MSLRRGREKSPTYSPYEAFVVEEMILRDHLAVDRTSLANERTLLSYLRTAIGCIAAGASALHFFDGLAMEALGAVLILLGAVSATIGTDRFRWYQRRIRSLTGIRSAGVTTEDES